MKFRIRRPGAAVLTVALMGLVPAVSPVPVSAGGGLVFGAPFMLKNPALNITFVFVDHRLSRESANSPG